MSCTSAAEFTGFDAQAVHTRGIESIEKARRKRKEARWKGDQVPPEDLSESRFNANIQRANQLAIVLVPPLSLLPLFAAFRFVLVPFCSLCYA
ncbi:unnamed protein product [Sphagnum jensenii]|uniref:Uncharacterized protein n=1 Tax=Sphagnum jensenii TaxID=128206 RepID=A0ABP0W515_9BRYO